MGKIKDGIIEFFQDTTGANSSKRLAFISSFIIVYYKFFTILDDLIEAEAYDQAVDIFIYGGVAGMLVMGGFVTAEVFKKYGK